jgi:hypothetical protein
MRQHNLKVTGSLQINGENVISASELSTLSASINSKIEGLNPSQIGTGSYTASISPDGIFRVNASTIITGSLSVSSLSGSGINYLAYSGGVVTAISGTAAIKYNQEFTAELGQTTFTPSVGYITDLIDVFYNGTKLSETDYTATNGSTIVLSQGADLAGDIIEVAIYNPVSGVSNNTLRQQTTFTASAAQTTFTVNYTPGLLDVYFNGSRLSNEEYTANNGTSIILSEAATGGEVIDIFVYSYQVGAFSGIGGQGQAGQFAYFSSQNGISGSSVISISGSSIIAGGNIIPLESGSSDLGSLEKPFRHIYVGTGSIFLVDNSGQVTNTISAQSIVTTDTLASGTIDLTKSLPTGTVSGSSQVVGILSSLNTATASFTPRISNLESKSASVDISITNINSFTASNSNESLNLKTGSYATTGSNTFFGTQTYSGSVYIANDLIVQGSSSIQYISASSVSIGTNIVQLNTANPSVRFAGLTIIDSGSIGGSGSFLYDSVQDEFIFVHRGNGSNITSSHFVLGPETYDNLGNETYLTTNIIPKGTGKEHLVDSCIFDNGTTTCIKNNLVGTGTISGTTTYSSTISCSPIGCFGIVCSPSFIGGTISGTNIYASTVSCSPVGCFTTLCASEIYTSYISPGGQTSIRGVGNRLGIGTANPLGVLSIVGGQNSLASLATYSSIEPLGIFNMFYINSGTYPFYLDIAAIGDTTSTNGGSNIRFLTHCGTANATPVERMRIDNCGRVGIGCNTPGVSLVIGGTDALKLPTGTTAQRPTGAAGLVRMNTTTGQPEWYNTTTSTWASFNQNVNSYMVEYLVVGGGGGGGYDNGAGGGAGGFVLDCGLSVSSCMSYSVIVGAGGGIGGIGGHGNASCFNGVVALGGGGGGGQGYIGDDGGSGGGSMYYPIGAIRGGFGTIGQGFEGGCWTTLSSPWIGAGGGGASQRGFDGPFNGMGGAGKPSTLLGNTCYYAGGGNGSGDSPGCQTQPLGGGGIAGNPTGGNGNANSGGGGGGGINGDAYGGSGGSGIVIIRYPGCQRGSGGTICSYCGTTIHVFTTSGTFVA